MGFLKKLFGGGSQYSDAGYFYVRPHDCNEVIRLRINMNNDLSQTDDGDGYHVRKIISATSWRCAQGEIHFYFDTSRNFISADTDKVELVTEDDYLAWVESERSESK